MGTKTEVIGSTFNKGGPLWRLFNILLPWGFIIIAIGGFLLALRFLQFSVAVSSLLYVIPVMLAGALLLIKNNDAAWFKLRIHIKQLPFRHLGLIYILFYVVSAMFLVSSPGRPLGYFFITGFISAVVFMQIISRRAKWTDYLIILEIVALSLNITWGVVLKYPLYFGSTDTLGHLAHILSILQTSHTFNMSLSYMNFPLYHIFIAMASELSGLSAITSLFIFMGLAWQIGILACFLILRKITNSRKIALLGCLLFAVSPQIIFYGTYPITRSLAFAFFLFWLYLIINKEKPVYIILSVVMMWAMIFTHHATFLYAIPVLLVIYLCQRVVRTPPRNRLPLLPVMVLFVSFFFYVFFVATVFTDMQIPAWLNSILSAETDVNNSIVTKEALQSPNNILYYSLLLIWFLVGIGYYLRSRRSMKLLGLSGIALASLVFIIFFIPGPLDLIPQSEAALSYRIPLLISPLVLLMMTFGIICLMNKESNIWRFLTGKAQIPLLTIILVGVSTYFSMISGANGADFSNFGSPSQSSRQYFTEAEMESFTFLQDNANHAVILYGDYETTRNFYNFPDDFSRRILTNSDTRYITKKGYILIRAEELQQAGGLRFSQTGFNDALFKHFDTVANVIAQQAYANNIFNNQSVYIYYVNPNQPQ